MKIYTLTVVYSERNGEVYEIEEKVEDEGSHYEIGGKNLEDVIDEEGLMNILRYESTEIASA
mgnify:FL=1|tara:strand:- start:718 stop:903 length:186 start_codon:yes stop_codon:yes gene_type:complete